LKCWKKKREKGSIEGERTRAEEDGVRVAAMKDGYGRAGKETAHESGRAGKKAAAST